MKDFKDLTSQGAVWLYITQPTAFLDEDDEFDDDDDNDSTGRGPVKRKNLKSKWLLNSRPHLWCCLHDLCLPRS